MSLFKVIAISAIGLSVFTSSISYAVTTTAVPAPSATAASQASPKVNINHASETDLLKVTGMSANKAKSLIAYRTQHGDFKTLEELKSVKGFKRGKNLKEVLEQLTVS